MDRRGQAETGLACGLLAETVTMAATDARWLTGAIYVNRVSVMSSVRRLPSAPPHWIRIGLW